MISIIIPSFKDPFLYKTIDSLLDNAKGKIEVIPVFDGYTPDGKLRVDPRIKPIHINKNIGMRGAINKGLKKARGKFIMKCDSNCLFAPNYDKDLAKNCQESWLVIPRRYSLDEINWKRDERRPVRDYHYLTIPIKTKGYGLCMSSQDWLIRGIEKEDPKFNVDDTMSFQGSCWLANRKYFMKKVGYLNDSNDAYGPFGGEQVEVGLKYWLGGGKIKVVKKTWYAHLSKRSHHYNKGMFTRDYKINENIIKSRTWTAKHWINNEEPNMIHPFSWLVKKFWPVPTWPKDKKLWTLK